VWPPNNPVDYAVWDALQQTAYQCSAVHLLDVRYSKARQVFKQDRSQGRVLAGEVAKVASELLGVGIPVHERAENLEHQFSGFGFTAARSR